MRVIDLPKKYASPAPRISSTIRISGWIVGRDAERESSLHAGGVGLERLGEEAAELCEFGDIVVRGSDLVLRQPEERE